MPPPNVNLDLAVRLPRYLPDNFRPEAILHATLTFNVDDHERLRFNLSDTTAYPPIDIKEFALRKQTAPATLPAPTGPGPKGPGRLGALELWVARPCWVVVELEGLWSFRKSGPGVTSKYDYGEDNCALTHIDPQGQPLSDHAPSAFCQMVYFAVCCRGKAERQSFNFHLEAEQDDTVPAVEIMLDPDVPDSGGGFPVEDIVL